MLKIGQHLAKLNNRGIHILADAPW